MVRLAATVVLAFMLLQAKSVSAQTSNSDSQQWSVARANNWSSQRDWPVGFNYTPRYAVNQLEMWQSDTFDTNIIHHK